MATEETKTTETNDVEKTTVVEEGTKTTTEEETIDTEAIREVVLPQFDPIVEEDGSIRVIGVNIAWKKKTAKKENITFMMCTTYKEAIEKLLKIKGGWKKIDILSIQDYDRESLEYRNYPILSTDEDGVIYIMKKEWEESNK